MKRITDANFNRSTEAARVLEEIARFELENTELALKLKNIRHKINKLSDLDYDNCLSSRDSENDCGQNIANPDKRTNLSTIFKANIKRLQQALRALAEYSTDTPENVAIFEKLRYEAYTIEKIMWEMLKEKYYHLQLGNKKLYLVTSSDNFKNDDSFLNAVASALEGGVKLIQLREKKLCAQKVIELGKKIKLLCQEYGATFIVNDRADIAAILDADGVHVGQDDISISDVRKIIGPTKIVGKSTHAPQQALQAVEEGADYIGVGPIFATPTKAGRTPVGIEYAKWVAQNIKIPAYAIGGIDLENCSEVLDTKIFGIAVVRSIINADNPKVVSEKFNEKINTSEYSD